MKTKIPTLGNSPIVQKNEGTIRFSILRAELVACPEHSRREAQIKKLEDPTISKMETVQQNQSYKDPVRSILEHTHENRLKVGGCPSTSSGTVRYNSIFSRFMNGVFVYG